jgi:predicted nucleotidyltransferase
MLNDLFSTKERVRILELVLTERGLTNSEIARRTELNKGLVSIFMRRLVDWDLMEKEGRKYGFRSTPLVKQIKILLNLTKLRGAIDNLPESIRSSGIYGSYATGENTSESDVDLWVFMTEPSTLMIGNISRRITDMTGKEVNIITLTPEKLIEMEMNDKPFLNSLLRESIVLKGEGFGQVE